MTPSESPVSGPGLEALLGAPAAPPPAGEVSDFGVGNGFAGAGRVCLALFMVVNTGSILVRLFTQRFLLKGLVVEDYMIVLAWLFQIGENTLDFICIRDGVGKHMWNITTREALQNIKVSVIETSLLYGADWRFVRVNDYVGIMYGLSMLFIRVAIILQFLRLFTRGGHNKATKLACWTWIALNSIYHILNTLLQAMQCLPREKIWNPYIVGGHCLSTKDIWGATGVFNVISDVAIFVLPLPSIYRLQLATRRKVFIMGIFATGIVACVASTMRTYYTYRTFSTSDETCYMFFIGIWTWIELCIGIIVLCLPVIPQFVRYVKASIRNPFDNLFPGQSRRPSALSLEQSPTPASGSKGDRTDSRKFPYVEISLASFEQRPGHEDGGVRVKRSTTFLREGTEEG